MCHESVLEFGPQVLLANHMMRKRVLEIGSYNVNGSLRAFVTAFHPLSYLGIDAQEGPGVDRIEDIEKPGLCERIGGPFDLVLCTEVLEHVHAWRTAVDNLKDCITDTGYTLITTRSKGFSYHAFPDDFWRYEVDDMKAIFSGFEIQVLKSDPQVPGVFLFARKPAHTSYSDLSSIELYSMHA